jgi:glycosyltransferase involved in cell wall biosynthesis
MLDHNSQEEHIPQVTVLMCVYNDERHVQMAIESILGQDFSDFEFLIIDDGSTDGTAEILRRMAERDSRIRIFTQENKGQTVASNRGLQLARGELVARIDSDDCSMNYRLNEEVIYLRNNQDVGLVGGGAEIIDADGKILGIRNIVPKRPSKTLLHRCIFQHSDVMFRRNLAISLGGYREKFRNVQDYDLWLRISDVSRVAKIDKVLGQWRLNRGGYVLSRSHEQKWELSFAKAFARKRRKGLRDDYETYVPPSPPGHRNQIGESDYKVVKALILMKSLRLIEARSLLAEVVKDRGGIRSQFLYFCTFAPKSFLHMLWSLREYYLNNLA